MKKILTILVISLSLCLLAGCGNTSKESQIFGTYFNFNPILESVYTITVEKDGDLYKFTYKRYSNEGESKGSTEKIGGKWDDKTETLTLTNRSPLQFDIKEHTMKQGNILYKKLTDDTKAEFEAAKQKALASH